MPKPNARAVEIQWADGYIPISIAQHCFGISRTTLYDWIAADKLPHRRSGFFHFVELQTLLGLCPHVDRAFVQGVVDLHAQAVSL